MQAADVVPSAQQGPVIQDVRLAGKGRLNLTIVGPFGVPQAGQRIEILYNGHPVARADTSRDGTISVTGLRPGVHQLVTKHHSVAYRLWDAGTAPPSALQQPAIVLQQATVRGQYGGTMMAPAVLAAGVTATALAVVLVGKNKSSSNSSPAVTANSATADHATDPASP